MRRTTLCLAVAGLIGATVPATADITLYVDGQATLTGSMSVARGERDCATATVVYTGPLQPGTTFRTFPGAGGRGGIVCWRRNLPPSPWNVCRDEGPCQVY